MAKKVIVWKRVTKRRRTVRVGPGAGTPAERISTIVERPPRRISATVTTVKAEPRVVIKPRRKTLRSRFRKLVSGSDRPIARADGDAAVRSYIAALPGWKRQVARRLDALIVRAVPDVRRAVKWDSSVYGVAGRGWFLGIHSYTDYVRVGFFRGTSLRPLPPSASEVRSLRYFNIHEHDDLDEALFMDWVEQASRLPGWARA